MILTARDVMKKDVITIPARASLREAALILEEEDIHGAPVVDAAGHVVGIVSRSDLVSEIVDEIESYQPIPAPRFYVPDEESEEDEEEPEPELPGAEEEDEEGGGTLVDLAPSEPIPVTALDEDKTVEDVMTTRVVSVDPDRTVGEVARIMREEGVHRVLVTENGKIAGIVSATDLLDCLEEYERRLRSLIGKS